MSTQSARTLSHPSNRAKPKDAKEKKDIFKGVLDNPFRIQWPSVPINLQSSILSCIVDLLERAADYHHQRCTESRKRKRSASPAEKDAKKSKKSVTTVTELGHLEVAEKVVENIATLPNLDQVDKSTALNVPPLLLRHLLFGINAVTKTLENQVHTARFPSIIALPKSSTIRQKSMKYIFVCKADVDPALLIAHLPHLVAAYNSTRPSTYIKLVPLPHGAESVLAQTLGIRRVTVLGVDADYPDDQRLTTSLASIPILTAPWLSQPRSVAPLIPTHVKHVRTTAPKDMKEAKELRIQGKSAAKAKKHRKTE